MDTIQILNLILIVTLVLILILGFIAVLLVMKMRKNKEPKQENIQVKSNKQKTTQLTREGKEIDSIYKFMEFDEILDNMIVRKNRKQYVMIISCKGINYDLLSEDEKNAVESGFIEFLNTLRFPIQLYVQTRKLNLTELITNYNSRISDIDSQIMKLNAQIESAKNSGNTSLVDRLEFEKRRKQNILEYGESITEYTKKISNSKNILQQKTYIVLSYYIAEYGDVSKYSKEEINDLAFSELYTRAQTLIRALASAEVSGRVLDSEEIMELLYMAYNRDQADEYTLKNALNSEYDRLYSTARDVMEEKKARIEKTIEEDAMKLASKSIVKADLINRERRVKERAKEMLDDYKDEISSDLYNETKKQIDNANLNKEMPNNSKRRIIKKNI